MNIIENLLSAFKSVYSHKMRSALTMLGIIIGISSVIMITSIGDGVQNTVFETIEQINKKMIQVYTWTANSMEDYINMNDADAIRQLNFVDRVSAISEWWGMEIGLRSGETKTGSILGADQDYGIIEEVEISLGRFISEEDVLNRSRVAVINPETAFEVFGFIDCIGQKMEIHTWYGKEEFTVIGVLKAVDQGGLSGMINTPLLRAVAVIPITTINDMFGYGEFVDFLGVTVLEEYSTSQASSGITRLLDIRHNQTDGYYAESMEASFDEIENILGAITGFVAFVAAISLFVGGVGVMNIMLVTVKERTKEIGIRKSLGATNGNIRFQFVMEAMILTALGGAIGILFGDWTARALGVVITGLMGTDVIPVISVNNIVLAFGVSSLVGIIFGVYPAGKAAKLDPIEALRYE